jgi:hypothetical protein
MLSHYQKAGLLSIDILRHHIQTMIFPTTSGFTALVMIVPIIAIVLPTEHNQQLGLHSVIDDSENRIFARKGGANTRSSTALAPGPTLEAGM